MAVTLRVPPTVAERSKQEEGVAEGEPNRYSAARFVLNVAKPGDEGAATSDDKQSADAAAAEAVESDRSD